MMRPITAVLIPVVLFLASAAVPAQSEKDADIGIDQHLNEQIPLDLVFRDEMGNERPLKAFFGERPVILVLAYYRCPRLCSLVLNGVSDGLQKVNFEIGKDYTVVTVSIDPRETPELAAAKKAAYVEHMGRPGAARGWHFLTGTEPQIQRLAKAVGFRYAYDARQDLFLHASGVMVATADGKLSRYLYGLEYSPRDLRYSIEDASAGKIGSVLVQPLRLLCFSYDPATGKYTLMTLRLIRIGSAATALLIGVFLVRAWRSERRSIGSTDTSVSGRSLLPTTELKGREI